MVSAFTGIIVQPNKAIIGENAFAHEAGIHQDGMLKDRKTYEIMTPEQVGVMKTKLVLGRHSGRHGLKVRLQEMGYTITDQELDKVYKRFIEIADKKKEVYDDDLRTLMGDETFKANAAYTLLHMQAYVGTNSIPTGSVRIQTADKLVEESATGDGPIDAIFNAIDRALNLKFTIDSYQVRSVTSGRQALGEVIVKIHNRGKAFTGRGVSTDIIEASTKAYLNALNQYEEYKADKRQKTIVDAV
jgi:2-isopropylmalate synthase